MIEVRNLSFSYSSKLDPVIIDLNALFPRGSLTAIVGASGKGKSTLLYILGLMLTPSSGSVVIDSEAFENSPDWRRANSRAIRFGFVFQDAILDASRTVLSNVLEGVLYSPGSSKEYISEAHLLLERFGVDLRASARPSQISGGQAQRIALCRALIKRPDIILADEPTGNLDFESASVVIGELEIQAKQGRVVIIATHDPRVIGRCDQVLEL